jgi:WD40 repeat protein
LPFIGAPEIVLSMAFSPDGDMLVVNGTDLQNMDKSWIALWDVANRQQLSEPLSHQPETFLELAFSRDGKTLASSSESSTVTLWDVDPNSWRKRACLVANRNLSYAEWKQHLGDEPYQATCPGVPVDIHGLVLEGERLAKSGELTRATDVLRQARDLDPQLQLEPGVQVKRLWRQSLIEQGEQFAKAGNVSRAVSLFQQAIDIDPDPSLEPKAKAGALAAPRQLQEGLRSARGGKIQQAVAAIAEARKLDPSLKIDAQNWGELCRLGSISDRPRDIKDACENAVAAEPLNGSFRDSRGIARARIADRNGAIDDFEAFVAWAREKLNTRIGYQEVARLRDQIPQREGWIRALAANEDPFTPSLINELRQQ